MESCKFTEFGLCVKNKLLRKGKEQKWLEEEINKRTGLFVDSGYMYKILTGQRNAPKIVDAIREICHRKISYFRCFSRWQRQDFSQSCKG